MLKKPFDWVDHCYGVGVYMMNRAERLGLDPIEMFVLGFLHDIGYVFTDYCHEQAGADILRKAGFRKELVNAVLYHGRSEVYLRTVAGEEFITAEYKLLTEADGHVSGTGQVVSSDRRLKDVLNRDHDRGVIETSIMMAIEGNKEPSPISEVEPINNIPDPTKWCRHVLGVALYMMGKARTLGLDPTLMFLCGFLHDIGKLVEVKGHSLHGATILTNLRMSPKIIHAVRHHGWSPYKVIDTFTESGLTKEYLLLVEADLSIDGWGKEIGFYNRLLSIMERYGEESDNYINARDTIKYLTT